MSLVEEYDRILEEIKRFDEELDAILAHMALPIDKRLAQLKSKKFRSFGAAGSPGTITQLIARGVQDLHLTGVTTGGTKLVQSGLLRPTKRGAVAQRRTKSKPRKVKQRKSRRRVSKKK